MKANNTKQNAATEVTTNSNIQTINKVTEEDINCFLHRLQKECKDLISTTTQFKKNKDIICKHLNISNNVYLSMLASYKRMKIDNISKENVQDKKTLKDFENVAKIVFKDLQTNAKYSEYTRKVTKECKDVNEFMNAFCKNYNNGQIITMQTLYNVEKCLIIKRYEIDPKPTYNKVFSLICNALDAFKNIRKNVVKEKEWELRKFVVGEIAGVYKFGEINPNTGRPKQGEKVDNYTNEDINNAVTFDNI